MIHNRIFIYDLSSPYINDVIKCAENLRRFVSGWIHPLPIQDVIDSDVLEKFPQLLDRDDQP